MHIAVSAVGSVVIQHVANPFNMLSNMLWFATSTAQLACTGLSFNVTGEVCTAYVMWCSAGFGGKWSAQETANGGHVQQALL